MNKNNRENDKSGKGAWWENPSQDKTRSSKDNPEPVDKEQPIRPRPKPDSSSTSDSNEE